MGPGCIKELSARLKICILHDIPVAGLRENRKRQLITVDIVSCQSDSDGLVHFRGHRLLIRHRRIVDGQDGELHGCKIAIHLAVVHFKGKFVRSDIVQIGRIGQLRSETAQTPVRGSCNNRVSQLVVLILIDTP